MSHDTLFAGACARANNAQDFGVASTLAPTWENNDD